MPLPSAMPISQHQLAAAVLAADHIVDRRPIAAFVADAATQPAPNPFPNTSAGAVRQVWQQRVVEFQSFGIQVAGLACLLTALSNMSVDEPLVQEILRGRAAHRERVPPWRWLPDRGCRALRQARLCSAGSAYAAEPPPDLQPSDAHPCRPTRPVRRRWSLTAADRARIPNNLVAAASPASSSIGCEAEAEHLSRAAFQPGPALMTALTDRQRIELAIPSYLVYAIASAPGAFIPADPALAARAEADIAALCEKLRIACLEPFADLIPSKG